MLLMGKLVKLTLSAGLGPFLPRPTAGLPPALPRKCCLLDLWIRLYARPIQYMKSHIPNKNAIRWRTEGFVGSSKTIPVSRAAVRRGVKNLFFFLVFSVARLRTHTHLLTISWQSFSSISRIQGNFSFDLLWLHQRWHSEILFNQMKSLRYRTAVPSGAALFAEMSASISERFVSESRRQLLYLNPTCCRQ